ncbi:CCA tRNA nucleotidyltransferase [Aquabacter sp. L1I39]|uniref:CCA tRNA nucleotidyltransferase n=1 Tax=Aquabacter sp. L1I39 TaxID=2820278 RepID=UPI001ADD38AB|nr:CCA tRNA nucleotidyltransferase [Aquabacter sp. L1I39]QTL03377.1 CCA tRNA nucleotidyltransferase [Aquabacter sp. L1I39]
MTVRTLAGSAWLDSPPLRRVLAVLDGEGEEVRLVGGAVRDALLGRPAGEVDLATTAHPAEVMRRARGAGLKAIPTGIEHGTVTVVADGIGFEVTTLREDVETDGRHAVVRFGRDWRADALRRDFTMNALYAGRDGEVIDFVEGLADLDAGRVRFIGDAEARIREDHLRILRLFRFHAGYGRGAMDPAALRAALRQREGMARLSRERIGREIIKLLKAPRAPDTVRLMSETGFLNRVLGGIGHLSALDRMARLEETLEEPLCALRRLGAVGVRIVEDADRLRERLRLSNSEHGRLMGMAQAGPMPSSPADARRLIYDRGALGAQDVILQAAARDEESAVAAGAALRVVRTWLVPKSPFRAADLQARGISPGPHLGAVLRRAESLWRALDFPDEMETVENILSTVLAERGG